LSAPVRSGPLVSTPVTLLLALHASAINTVYNWFMNNRTQIGQDKDSEQFIRPLEIEVFGTFMSRALSIVRKEEDNESIADACRLVDAALKAARGDGSTPAPAAGDNGLKDLIEELRTGYRELRTGRTGSETTSGEDEP